MNSIEVIEAQDHLPGADDNDIWKRCTASTRPAPIEPEPSSDGESPARVRSSEGAMSAEIDPGSVTRRGSDWKSYVLFVAGAIEKGPANPNLRWLPSRRGPLLRSLSDCFSITTTVSTHG